MSMDFFQQQEKARNRTVILVILYCLGLVAWTAFIIAVALICFAVAKVEPIPEVIIFCVVCIVFLVISGSIGKMTQLSESGGCGLAESLGGRQVCASTTDLAERQLSNIVEEMALATGVPMPTLYVMDRERCINAFAAGYSISNACVLAAAGANEVQMLAKRLKRKC